MESFYIDELEIIPVGEPNDATLGHCRSLFNIQFLVQYDTRTNGSVSIIGHSRYTFQVPCDMLFHYAGLRMVRDLLPNMEIPSHILDVVLTELISTARVLFDANSQRDPSAFVLTLAVNLYVRRIREDVSRFVDSLEKIEADHDGSCGETKRCSICLNEFSQTQHDDGDEDKSEVVRTPCAHLYHKSCVLRWLHSNPSCPMCRQKLI